MLLAQSRRELLHCTCPLMTQSGDGPVYKSRVNYWALVQLTYLSSSNNIVHVDKLRVENEFEVTAGC